MNQIARQLKEKNIAEYLIYMWQEEDLIRANHGELEEIEANVIARYPEDQLRLQKKPISEGTAKAVEAITSFLSMLANYYDKDRKGELKLDE